MSGGREHLAGEDLRESSLYLAVLVDRPTIALPYRARPSRPAAIQAAVFGQLHRNTSQPSWVRGGRGPNLFPSWPRPVIRRSRPRLAPASCTRRTAPVIVRSSPPAARVPARVAGDHISTSSKDRCDPIAAPARRTKGIPVSPFVVVTRPAPPGHVRVFARAQTVRHCPAAASALPSMRRETSTWATLPLCSV